MKKALFLLLLLGSVVFAKEWVSLFNGKNLKNWEIKCVPADAGQAWFRVVDETIEAFSLNDGKHDYIWLYSEKEYANFKLKLKFQAFRGSPGNSGVQVRSRYDDEAGWLDGPQIDINPPGPWRTGMVWDETRNNKRWLWPEIPQGEWVDESMANPDLTFYYVTDDPAWNDMEITAVGTTISAILNGVNIMQWDGAGVLDDENHQLYNVGMNGHIALQIHTKDKIHIRFKDIYIQELK